MRESTQACCPPWAPMLPESFAIWRLVVGDRRRHPGARLGLVTLATEHHLERRKTREHVLAARGGAHGAEAQDLALQRTERRPDLDAEVVEQPLTDALVVHTLGH